MVTPMPSARGPVPDAARRRPVAVDLFSGVGGMALGFEQAGFDVAAAVERDRAHAAAHRFNFPDCEVLAADIETVTGERLLEAVARSLWRMGRHVAGGPRVDVVFGGPPCQGFSVGGHLDPDDPRNLLLREFLRMVEELEPTAFVIENVPAMATRVLPGCTLPVPDWLARRASSIGYRLTAPTTLNASAFGVPQHRRRLVLIGVRRGVSPPAPPLALCAPVAQVPSRPARPGEAGHPGTDRGLPLGPTVGDALADLPDCDGFAELLSGECVVVPGLDGRERSAYAEALRGDRVDAQDLAAARTWDSNALTASMRTVHDHQVARRFDRVPAGAVEPTSRLFRPHPDGLSRTLRAGSGPDRGSYSAPRPIHPRLPRVLTVREAARLHGFPDWFRFTAAKWHGFRQVGNAVPPPLARAVAAAVRDALQLPQVPEVRRHPAQDSGLLRVANGAGRRRAQPRCRGAPVDLAA